MRTRGDESRATDLLAEISRRVGRVTRALDEALDGAPAPRPRARRRRKTGTVVVNNDEQKIILCLHEEALSVDDCSSPESAALTYTQLLRRTGINDEALGLALLSLIPDRLGTRYTTEERIYFLPRRYRDYIQENKAALRAGAQLIAA